MELQGRACRPKDNCGLQAPPLSLFRDSSCSLPLLGNLQLTGFSRATSPCCVGHRLLAEAPMIGLRPQHNSKMIES
jgi:hypothetical protein